MTRTKYVEELNRLVNNVRIMGVSLEDTLDQVIVNLQDRNPDVAQKIIADDDIYDNKELEIERTCFDLVLTQAPVAADWREIASCLKLVGDLERIADHCSDISQYTLRLMEREYVPMTESFKEMLKVMRSMVYDSITAISENDAELARRVIATDDNVDELFHALRQELTELMQRNPQNVPQYVDYLMIAKYVERIADHSTNIAEWVLYIVKNELQP